MITPMGSATMVTPAHPFCSLKKSELLPNLLQDHVTLDVPLSFSGPNMLGHKY